MTDEEQHAFELQFQQLCERIKNTNDVQLENVEAFWSPVKSDASAAVIAVAPIKTAVYPKRHFVVNQLAERAMTETGTNLALIILVDIDLGHWPYSGFYLLDRSILRGQGT
jgi:hypothetical protein